MREQRQIQILKWDSYLGEEVFVSCLPVYISTLLPRSFSFAHILSSIPSALVPSYLSYSLSFSLSFLFEV